MTALTDNELQAINNRCEAATPGPFTIIEPIQAEDGDGNCIHGAYSYPGGIEDANGDAVCTFGSENGSGHMFEHKANKVFLSNARTDIPALLGHIEAQNAVLDQAWYVLDAAAAGKAPRSAAIMARKHVEKFIHVKPLEDALAKCEAESQKRLAHCRFEFDKAENAIAELTAANERERVLVEALMECVDVMETTDDANMQKAIIEALKQARAALASVKEAPCPKN